MKVIITGSTGLIGKGVLLESLKDEGISSILVINRESVGIQHPKLKEIIHTNFFELKSIETELAGYDACFFCLGISAYRMSEQTYSEITYDLTLNFARTLLKHNKKMIFCYVSGAGTDSSEKGRMMWARVKGKTENDLLKTGFTAAYMFRPGYIQPIGEVRSKNPMYNRFMSILKYFYPIIKTMFPKHTTTTENIGKAMIHVALEGYTKQHLESSDINSLAKQ